MKIFHHFIDHCVAYCICTLTHQIVQYDHLTILIEKYKHIQIGMIDIMRLYMLGNKYAKLIIVRPFFYQITVYVLFPIIQYICITWIA